MCACGEAEQPAEVPDTGGPRLAVLSPALAITLRDLGHADRIVARHGWDMATDASVPVAGDQRGIDYEVLLGVEPDTVVMEAGAEPTPARLVALGEEHGWRIVRHPMLTLADVRSAILEMDAVARGGEGDGGRAGALVASLDEATRQKDGLRARGGRVLMLVSAGPPGVLGPGSFHYEIGASMGLEMLPREGAAFINMGLEEVRSLEPDTVVMIVPGAAEDELATLIEPLKGLGMRAVREDRVILLSGEEWLTPSTAMIGFAEELARRIGGMPVAADQSSK